jgi:hypothetical protein
MGTERHTNKELEMPGIEPGAFHMQSERSTTELHPLLMLNCLILTIQCKGSRSRIKSENNGNGETQHGDKDADRRPGAGYAGTGTQNHGFGKKISFCRHLEGH